MATPARKQNTAQRRRGGVFRDKKDLQRGLDETLNWLRESGARECTLEELEDSLSRIKEPVHRTIRRLRDEEG